MSNIEEEIPRNRANLSVLKKPAWIRTKLQEDSKILDELLAANGINTICREATCPNRHECYHAGTATFLIAGKICTRQCTFCDVLNGIPNALDPSEGARIAKSAAAMNLTYVVITSVNRDDLADGGASQFVDVIEQLKAIKNIKIEVLTPDFNGNINAINMVVKAKPHVYNHNIETVGSLYYVVRPQADYKKSLDLLRQVRETDDSILVKSGLMVGLGETVSDLKDSIKDIYDAGAHLLTIGQYLAPSVKHHPVEEYVHPKQFLDYKEYALDLGFKAVASGPMVRSSYHADEMFASS